jgi:hypothetical protein
MSDSEQTPLLEDLVQITVENKLIVESGNRMEWFEYEPNHDQKVKIAEVENNSSPVKKREQPLFNRMDETVDEMEEAAADLEDSMNLLLVDGSLDNYQNRVLNSGLPVIVSSKRFDITPDSSSSSSSASSSSSTSIYSSVLSGLPVSLQQAALSNRQIADEKALAARRAAKTYDGTIYQHRRGMKPSASVVDPLCLLDGENPNPNKQYPDYYDAKGKLVKRNKNHTDENEMILKFMKYKPVLGLKNEPVMQAHIEVYHQRIKDYFPSSFSFIESEKKKKASKPKGKKSKSNKHWKQKEQDIQNDMLKLRKNINSSTFFPTAEHSEEQGLLINLLLKIRFLFDDSSVDLLPIYNIIEHYYREIMDYIDPLGGWPEHFDEEEKDKACITFHDEIIRNVVCMHYCLWQLGLAIKGKKERIPDQFMIIHYIEMMQSCLDKFVRLYNKVH